MLQNVMEDVKTLKEAHEKAQGKVQELPELTSQVRVMGSPAPAAPHPVYTEAHPPLSRHPRTLSPLRKLLTTSQNNYLNFL